MANELRVTTTLALYDVSLSVSASDSKFITPTTKLGIVKEQTITTAAAQALDFTGIGAARYIQLKNKDTANFIDIGPDSGGTMVGLIRLKAGENCTLPLKPSTTIKAQADTASCKLGIMATDT